MKEIKIKKGKDDIHNRVKESEKYTKKIEDRKFER